MGLDIWFAEDIRNALLAANEANAATAMTVLDLETGGVSEDLILAMRAYREGFKAALATIALAFGIAPQAFKLMPLEGHINYKERLKMDQRYWILKFYQSERCIGVFYSDLAEALDGFAQARDGLGNPHLGFAIDTDPTGEKPGKLALGPLSEFDLVELVELSGFEEEIIDSASTAEEDE